MIIKSKRAAMEMSVGTMVTIVLLMVVLVLGIFFVQRIFESGTDAIDIVDSQVQSQLEKLFAAESTKVAMYPNSREITVERGDSPKGFAFSIRNNDVETAEFAYATIVQDISECGSTMTEEKAQDYLLGGEGTITLGPGQRLEGDETIIVRYSIPESAPECTLIYKVEITKDSDPYSTIPGISVTIK